MRQTAITRQADLFDSTNVKSVSFSNETELELVRLLRQLLTELIDQQPVTTTIEGNREQDHR